jgi:hypothetical protein
MLTTIRERERERERERDSFQTCSTTRLYLPHAHSYRRMKKNLKKSTGMIYILKHSTLFKFKSDADSKIKIFKINHTCLVLNIRIKKYGKYVVTNYSKHYIYRNKNKIVFISYLKASLFIK